MQKFILTSYKTYTPVEVIDIFSKHVKPENVEILVNNLSDKEMAENILSFIELDGEIHFNLGNGEGLIKVSKK